MQQSKVTCDFCNKEVIYDDTINPFKSVGISIHIGYGRDENVSDHDLCLDCFQKTVGKLKRRNLRWRMSRWLEDDDPLVAKPSEEQKERFKESTKTNGLGAFRPNL